MRILTVSFESAPDFLRAFHWGPEGGELVFATRARVAPDERVLVDLRLPRLWERMVLGGIGQTAYADHARVRFFSEERMSLAFAQEIAEGRHPPSSGRRHARFPLSIRAEWSVTSEPRGRIVSATFDVSATGAFVHSLAPPRVGTKLDVVMCTVDGRHCQLRARVARTRTALSAASPKGDWVAGMGLHFESRDPAMRRWREHLRRIDACGQVAV